MKERGWATTLADAQIERLGRDRFGEEFGDAGVARSHHAFYLGVAASMMIGTNGLALAPGWRII